MKAGRATVPILVLLWGSTALLSTHLNPNQYPGGRSRDPRSRSQANRSALAVMMGEFRTSVSDLLLIKTERYLHAGVAYVHLDEDPSDEGSLHEHPAGAEEENHHADHDHDHDHDHHDHDHHSHPDHEHPELPEGPLAGQDPFANEGEPDTVIPVAAKDYRGWIGSLHRQVKPWQDPAHPHVHGDGTQLLPWFRMMTLSDPHYIRGYNLGSYWLMQQDPVAAMGFVEEGILQNPDAFQLYVMKGFLLIAEARAASPTPLDKPDDIQRTLLDQARMSFGQAARKVVEQRPRNVQGDISLVEGWSGYEETDAMSAFNMTVRMETEYGDPERGRQLARYFLTLMPDNPVLQKMAD